MEVIIREERYLELTKKEKMIKQAIEYIKENYDNVTYTYSKEKDIYCKVLDDILEILKGEIK